MRAAELDLALALSDLAGLHSVFRAPASKTVAESAAMSLKIKQTGVAARAWGASETPYMVEPMNTLASREHDALIFTGPARTGKTLGLLLGWMAHAVVSDPGDMLFIQMTKDKAREWSITDFSRAVDNSPALSGMLSSSGNKRNTHDVMFKNGMWVRIAWPTVSNVSGSTYRYVGITDLDRIPNAENLNGEGSLFELARKRVTTFLSRGMCLAESSPGIELTDPSWRPATLHEAPPVTGILGLYNASDRRRWYWSCPDCYEWFEAKPGLDLFNLPSVDELLPSIRTMNIHKLASEWGSRIVCPHCASLLPVKHKPALNASGIWVPEGRYFDDLGLISGERRRSKVAGFWLGGVAAAYQPWESLVSKYLSGLRDYAMTGSEETLKTTCNTDQGVPYMSRHLVESSAGRTKPEDRAEPQMQRYIVPDETRTLLAAVDVQGGQSARFVVQVIAVGAYREQWIVDRYEIRQSKRETHPGSGEFAPLDPASYPEDWDVLTDRVLRATYRTSIPGRELRVKRVIVDSAGEDGVTDNAYAYARRLKVAGLRSRLILYKGGSIKDGPVIRKSLVGRRGAKDKGDVELYVCNPNLLSDIVDAGLKRSSPGPGYIHFPSWFSAAQFDELSAEVRRPDGTWGKIRKRNETFDLCRMIAALNLILGLDKYSDWSAVPEWLAPLESNSEVISDVDRRRMQEAEVKVALLPNQGVWKKPKVRARRRVASSYIG